ncbi:MAG TPA: efflux RND transporter periplasmic adaptor subunit [Steroidobacteraceae bacterium]|nr:efflux RND transporter periplasmic adaptor subunit [Steroidobacteraceae bacterium]
MDQPTHPPERHALERRALSVRRQTQIVLVLGLCALGILSAGWAASLLRSQHPAPADELTANGELHLSALQLAGLTINPVSQVSFRSEEETDGRITLNSDTATQVFSPYSGRVVRVIAGIGEHVGRGAPLFSIEASEFAQTQSDLLNALSQLKLARIGEERRHAAFESKGGSLQDWQQAQADLAAAGTALDSVRNRLRIFGESDAQIAALEREKAPNPVTNVVAPIGGVVTDRQVGPGQYLQAGGATPVYTIGDLSTVWLVAEVREVDAPRVTVGQDVEVRVLALPGRVFRAKLTAVGAGVDPATRRVPVRATIENPDGKLKPQMFATFNIITSGNSESLAVPEEAVVREGDSARVWVLERGNDLALRQIRTGRISNGMVEVLAGLKAGEKIVTRGSLFIDRAAQPG